MKPVQALGVMALALLWTGCTASNDEPGEGPGIASMSSADRLNPLIALHEAYQPVFGLYAPSPGGGRGLGEAPPPVKEPGMRATETLAYGMSDFVFDGSMEGGVEEGLPAFAAFADALHEAGANARTHPLIVKMAKISDQAQATRDVALELDAGVSGVMFVEVESAEEARMGLNAMRYESLGGTRPNRVGAAPGYWGVSEDEYRAKADLWPLNPEGELISWVIVESHEGLANVREIAAVPGIGVLWPGAGTLRGLFSTTDKDGNRKLDAEGWENAIQQVLSACKEFDIPCGFPSNASDIEMRMDQGFSVFVMGWGDRGFATVEMGRSVAER